MHIQPVTFALEGISDTDLRVGAEAIAPQFTALPGLHSKVWMSDPASNTYVTGVRSRDFGVIEGATRITAPHRAVRV